MAGLVEEIPLLLKDWEDKRSLLSHNKKLFEIYEGNLYKYLQHEIYKQFSSERARGEILERIPPINILNRFIDKLSRIYQENPIRMVEDGTDQDQDMVGWYSSEMQVNKHFNDANEFFNLYKSCLIQPFLSRGEPKIRVVPNDRFTVFSNDLDDPLRVTHITIALDEETDLHGRKCQVFVTWTDDQFVIYDSDKRVRTDRMAQLGNPMGINPYGKIPYIYVNRSSHLLTPLKDEDTYKLTVLIPILLGDLNYVVKYQAFSIVYAIGLQLENPEKHPDSIWQFSADPTSDASPSIGQLKPEADIAEVLNLIQAQLAFWLNARGVRPGAVGQLAAESFSSGISKMVDEMDTFEDREKQTKFFEKAEKEFWELIMHHMHPIWVLNPEFEMNAMFSPQAYVHTEFAEQIPMQSRGQLVADLVSEVNAGFLPRNRAIRKLNPELTDYQIEELLLEIDQDRTVEVPSPDAPSESSGYKPSGTTSEANGHSHSYSVDDQGNGQTGEANGHMHEISSYSVAEADGHTHELEQDVSQ